MYMYMYSHESIRVGKGIACPVLQISPLRLQLDTEKEQEMSECVYEKSKLKSKNKTELTESDVDSCFGMMRAVM